MKRSTPKESSGNVFAIFGQSVANWIKQGLTAPHSVFTELGPEEALVLLQHSNGNRTMRDEAVQQYLRDIVTPGRWSLTHQGFGLTQGGVLYDGHHRLTAISQAPPGTRVAVQLTFGMPDSAIGATDSGIARTARDRFSLGHGFKVSTPEIAAMKVWLRLTSPSLALSHSGVRYSDAEVIAAMEENSEGIQALSAITSRWPASVFGALLFVYPVNPHAVVSFASDVARGTGLPASSPAFTMREWLTSTKSARKVADRAEIIIHTLYALRAYLRNQPLLKFSVHERHGYNVVEDFKKMVEKAKAVMP